MKVMILTDLEGPCGVNGRADTIGNQILNKPTAQQALVNEVNACCDGLVAAGATEIVVLDGHGGSYSIDIFKLHPAASLMQTGGQNPVCYLDSTFDAFVQIGAHAMQSSLAYLCHTFNSHGLAQMLLNGKEIGEIGVGSRIAGYFNVPTILVSADEAGCREAEMEMDGKVITVPTKQAWGRYTAVNYPPEQVYQELRRKSEEALRNRAQMGMPPKADHYVMRLRMMCPNFVFDYEKRGAKRLDEATVELESDDFIDLYAQRNGWTKGVHNRKYGITPDWVFRGV